MIRQSSRTRTVTPRVVFTDLFTLYESVLKSCPLHNFETVQDSFAKLEPGRVAQSVGHLTRKSGVMDSIPGLVTYFCFSFRFFKNGGYQLLAKVYARSTG